MIQIDKKMAMILLGGLIFLNVATLGLAVYWKGGENIVKSFQKGKVEMAVNNETENDEQKTETVEATITPTATPTPEPTIEPTTTPTPTKTVENGIWLSGSTGTKGINLNWKVTGLNSEHGFKIIKNTEGKPVYPGSEYVYLSESGIRAYTWGIKDGQNWHIRVCTYNGEGKCLVYSNEIVVKAPSGETSENSGEVKSISLSGSKDGSSAKLHWNVEGNSSKGFKVVWSQNDNPTYPCREGDSYDYLSESGVRDWTRGMEGGKTIKFRVCEYLGGKCGVYSNQVVIGF
ncbi:MAG TPA: hypothetical protein PK370_02380, partial [Candidatus Woesebacteria bacterium]|nr:hypothetical protein [Candidatus Woesebacteria bacterium]